MGEWPVMLDVRGKHGEGNGNPLRCSCLENPGDGGAWWAAVYGVTQSQTLLKRLSSSSSSKREAQGSELGSGLLEADSETEFRVQDVYWAVPGDQPLEKTGEAGNKRGQGERGELPCGSAVAVVAPPSVLRWLEPRWAKAFILCTDYGPGHGPSEEGLCAWHHPWKGCLQTALLGSRC